MSAGRDIRTYLGRAIADVTVDRRADLRVAEIEPCGCEFRLRLPECCLRLLDRRIEHRQLLASRVEPRGAGGNGRLGGAVSRLRLVGIAP